MDFYKDTGILILGTRLKRLSERFLSEVAKIYEKLNIDFEPAWFPMIFLLYTKGPITITEISDQLNVSQPATSQMVAILDKKGLLEIIPDSEDRRRKIVNFSTKGKEFIQKLIPVWDTLESIMLSIFIDENGTNHVVDGFNQLENRLSSINFGDSVIEKLEQNNENNHEK